MRVISFKRLREYYEEHPETEGQLQAWYHKAKKATWRMPLDVSDAVKLTEKEDEASKVGVRYRILFSAAKIWYHYICKSPNPRARRDNRFALSLLEEFFEIVNNPKMYEKGTADQRKMVKFKKQIPFLLDNKILLLIFGQHLQSIPQLDQLRQVPMQNHLL